MFSIKLLSNELQSFGLKHSLVNNVLLRIVYFIFDLDKFTRPRLYVLRILAFHLNDKDAYTTLRTSTCKCCIQNGSFRENKRNARELQPCRRGGVARSGRGFPGVRLDTAYFAHRIGRTPSAHTAHSRRTLCPLSARFPTATCVLL